MDEAQLNLTERIIEEQKLLGIKNIKVMTNEQSQSFVASYNEAAKLSDGDKLNGMMLSLASNYGDNEGLAIQQLRADGLPFGATVSSGLGNSVLAEIALSFDTKEEKKEIKEYLKTNDIKIDEMKEEITDGVSDFMNIVLKNTPNDSSESLTKTNEIKEFLTFVAAQKMIGNPEMEQSEAIQFAVDSWNNNFVLTDTYYIGKQQGDRVLNLNETNRIQDTTDLLRTYYLDELDVVAFQSNIEDDPVVLSNKMRSQMSINGEWRNTADGEGVIFGIVLDNGFAPVINNKGEQIIFKFDDRSGLVPGTDIVIDFDVGFNEPENTPATMLIDTFEKANQLARDEGITYEEALEKIRKPDIPNIEFDDGKKNSKISIDDQSSKTDFSIISKANAGEINFSVGERVILGDNITNENSNKNLQKFITAVRDVESGGGKNTYNKSTTAAGDFQFKMLTKDKNKKGSAFQTGLQRIENLYKAKNETIPNWVKKARDHNDPRKLTKKQQEELFLINLQQQKGTDALIKAMLSGDMNKAMRLYAEFHHTNLNVLDDKEINKKFNKAYK
jgi:hypothetical protein